MLSVIVCTNRPGRALRSVEAIVDQGDAVSEVIVVDDCAEASPALAELAARSDRVRVVRSDVRGLSVARNAGWRAACADWVVYVDDDVLVDPGWGTAMEAAIAAHPGAEIVSCDVRGPADARAEGLIVSEHRVHQAAVYTGRWTKPWVIGLTSCLGVKRSALERLGGFDERLGPGTPDFPSAEDMDLNYRFLRDGGTAYASPLPTAAHEQWRPTEDLAGHFRGYMAGWTGFATKHVRQGDLVGGAWLWSLGLTDLARMLASALRRRSSLRLRVAVAKARGLVHATVVGLSRRW